MQTSDPECNHTVRLLDLVRLPSHHRNEDALIVSIFESPGRNYLADLADFGEAWLRHDPKNKTIRQLERLESGGQGQISLLAFLDFAIGASKCLELLHHGLNLVHGELRADAFHYNQDTRAVKMVNFGSGPRSFEQGLTSAGWSTLSRELGIMNKLQFIAPEQTGRMAAEPDTRTDIYSLGVLLWTLLTGEPAFRGDTPIDVLQAVLNRRIPPVSSKRMDVPDIISSIIQKMTQKQIDERYHSISGSKYDFMEIQRILGEGDGEALVNFKLGTKDVSSFFMLPTETFGRVEENGKVIAVIDKTSRIHQQPDRLGSGIYGLASDSQSTVSDRIDNVDDTRSNSISSNENHSNRYSSSIPTINGAARQAQTWSQERKHRDSSIGDKPPLESSDSKESVQTTFSAETYISSNVGGLITPWSGSRGLPSTITKVTPGHVAKKRRKCEVILVSGDPGMGKSSLLQGVQEEIRRRSGYSSTTKFERANSNPFESFFRCVSSLFRQIFSESDIDSEYHNHVRRQLKPLWPMLCNVLDLPDNLLDLEPFDQRNQPDSLKVDQRENSSLYSDNSNTPSVGHLTPHDSSRGGASTQSLKLINMFAEVLRVLSKSKLICLGLDDLEKADGESLELLGSIIARKLGIVLIISCRDTDTLPKTMKSVLDSGCANVTRIQLPPLNEEDVVSLVAATLHADRSYVFPLAIVCLERSHGNPFYLRQMLEVCYQKGCLWYTWKESAWRFDLDRVFAEFETETYDQQLNTNFVTRRLLDLPAATRSILAWASLLGNNFSFTLLQRLLTMSIGDGDEDADEIFFEGTKIPRAEPLVNVVQGLNAALQAFILKPTEVEDRFQFTHDRYMQASASLKECYNVERMHFLIACTMMSDTAPEDGSSLYTKARHIRASAQLIKARVRNRQRYREILVTAARKAIDAGSRATALQHFEACIVLMDLEPWTSAYAETLAVYTKAAELYWHEGQFTEADSLLTDVIVNARTATDKAPAWVIHSRVLARQGKLTAAFDALKTSMSELGLTSSHNPSSSWEICDTMYEGLRERLGSITETEIIERPMDTSPGRAALGMVVAETISAAFWNNELVCPSF